MDSLETLCARIDALLAEKPFVRIAIDGNCGGGKSTLGEWLRARYDATLFHMDDYYVPIAGKTPERLAQPGGNADYERFYREVLAPRPGSAVITRPFDCATQSLLPPVRTQPKPLTIIEGSYSLHPYLRGAYDLTVFLALDPAYQRQRILHRNGPEGLAEFEAKWIPLENAYFEALEIRAHSDVVLQAPVLTRENEIIS